MPRWVMEPPEMEYDTCVKARRQSKRERELLRKIINAEFEVTGGVGISTSISMQKLHTVCLTSIYNPQIEGKFTETSGGSTNLFYGCKD